MSSTLPPEAAAMTTTARIQFPRMPRGPRQERRYTERPRQRGLVQRAILEAFRKLDPRLSVANPVMFVVWCGTVLCLLLTLVPNLLDGRAAAADRGFNALISLTLLATLLFANFAEALAEGRGKAQADALRRTQARTQARRQQADGSIELVDSSTLRKGDLVLVQAGDVIPAGLPRWMNRRSPVNRLPCSRRPAPMWRARSPVAPASCRTNSRCGSAPIRARDSSTA
jgi:K+-transporting ATPase ATPase B chain